MMAKVRRRWMAVAISSVVITAVFVARKTRGEARASTPGTEHLGAIGTSGAKLLARIKLTGVPGFCLLLVRQPPGLLYGLTVARSVLHATAPRHAPGRLARARADVAARSHRRSDHRRRTSAA